MRSIAACVVASALTATGTAYAEPPPSADALFEQGRKALAAGDLDTACARFAASDKMEPAPGTKANLGACEEKRGRLATAYELDRTALRQLPPGDPRVPPLKQRVAVLEPRVPRLVLNLSPAAPKETVVREGERGIADADSFGLPVLLDPGVHHLAVASPGRAAKAIDVNLIEGETETLEVEPGPAEIAGRGFAAPVRREKRDAEVAPAAAASPGPWIVGGIGLAGLVVGGVTGGIVLQKKSDFDGTVHSCSLGLCTTTGGDAARSAINNTLGPMTTVALVVGGVGLVAGGAWLGVTRRASVGVGPALGGVAWRAAGAW